VQQGLLTSKQLRSSAWRRLQPDVYADAALAVTHRVLLTAVGLTLPAGAGLAGRTAGVLWGVADLAAADDPVEVLLPRGMRWNAGEGVRVRAAAQGQRLVQRGGWLCTTRVDTAVDLLRWRPVEDGVVLLDRLVKEGMVRLDAVREAAAALPRLQGSARAREASRLADGLAESPQESRLRLLIGRSGLPAPIAQHRVFDDQGFIARVDFAYPELRIAIEYDGLWHGERRAFLDDRRRLNRLVAAGWVVLHVTLDDLRRPELLMARIRALRVQRRAQMETR
jgi:hypothetical protein